MKKNVMGKQGERWKYISMEGKEHYFTIATVIDDGYWIEWDTTEDERNFDNMIDDSTLTHICERVYNITPILDEELFTL